MHYTIHFDERKLTLTDDSRLVNQTMAAGSTAFFKEELHRKAVLEMLDYMQKKEGNGMFFHRDAGELLAAFKNEMTVIAAGGGLVRNAAGAVLLIYRRRKWDLPKGKLDPGETIEAAALREVEEETGVTALSLDKQIATTYHTYREKGRLVLKESHWFLMHTTSTVLVPQTSEDIEQCQWVAPDALTPYLQNTHPSIAEVLEAGLQ